MKPRGRLLLRLMVGALAVYLVSAVSLAFWPSVAFKNPPVESFFPSPAAYPYEERNFRLRDGAAIFARVFGAPSEKIVVLIHGITGDSSQLNVPCGLLREASGARIVAIDLRGHGRSSGAPWDVDYIGQYEDDVADVIAALRAESPGAKIILAGHSMGGGIALRYALSAATPTVEGYLLIAPLLGSSSPSAPVSEPGNDAAARAVSQLVYFRTPRFFGVLMLNFIGVHALNHLPILYFNLAPKMPAYDFAALASMQPNAPRDYRTALQAIRVPLLLVAGSRDEAFRASAYPAIIAEFSRGKAVLIDQATHVSVLHDARSVAAMKLWLDGV
jgi:alpha-beta hydrolase superfamily lysophospholipase